MYGDGGGLYLQVTGDGKEKIAKSWIFRYRFNGHTSKAGKPLAREMGLGSLDTWTLAEARASPPTASAARRGARPHRSQEDAGGGRSACEGADGVLRAMCQGYICDHRAGWKNVKQADQWTSSLTT